MSWNGAGVFNRIFSWVADKNAGIDITASRMDADTDDITSNGFGNTLTRDGQGSASANLPMNNFRHTGVGNAQARTDYAAMGQVQDGVALNWTVAAGTADAITVTYTPALTALIDGQLCFVRASAANATTTPTFAPNGLTAHTITKYGGQPLVAGDIPAALAECVFRYDLANTRWELLNPTVGKNIANGTVLGNVSGGAGPPVAISPPTSPAGAFKNLSIKVASNTTVALAADGVVTTDGTAFLQVAPNSTINLATTGTNALDTGVIAIDTWYSIWAIAKSDGTVAGLASTSATAPTMPSGYTFKARLGWVRTIHSSAILYGTWQLGRKAQYVVGLAQTSVLPVMKNIGASAWTAISVTPFVPSTASEIVVIGGVLSNSTTGLVLLAPNNSYATDGQSGFAAIFGIQSGIPVSISCQMLLESTNIYYGAAAVASVNIACAGWVDNI